ncbi:MAG: hypothetical protein HUJ76_08745 [Parasporobacterium sp.]|nr:hypothetical protein [Parasporobacterium sp.]
MRAFYFADYRMLADDAISENEHMQYLDEFQNPMPFTHTFTIHLGNPEHLNAEYEKAMNCPEVCKAGNLSLHDGTDSWSITSKNEECDWKYVVCCSRDYSELTVYMPVNRVYLEEINTWAEPYFPFSLVRAACEAGMVMRDGVPLHASLIEKDGNGIIFLGPSGMGKSTQAKLWMEYQNADFVIGDRPVLRCIDGAWHGFGMPWDGKDNIRRQKSVPIKACISLEQAGMNHIRRLDPKEAMQVLLRQAMMPMWDEAAMDDLLRLISLLPQEVPFYHLQNLADEECVRMTCNTVFR